MRDDYQFAIFETDWGMCGLLCRGSRIVRFSLPAAVERIKKTLITGIRGNIIHNQKTRLILQKSVQMYFRGLPADFHDIELDLSSLTKFQQMILTACTEITYGQTTTYTDLATRAGRPNAVRAAALALAANPIPLIIPCHRIVCKNGKLGGFSAVGGISTKSRLLRLERSVV